MYLFFGWVLDTISYVPYGETFTLVNARCYHYMVLLLKPAYLRIRDQSTFVGTYLL